MKLKRVIYELYEVDLLSLHDHPEWHEINREIFLEFDNGLKRYFSWCNEPVQYSVGFQDHRFNVNEPDHVIDASEWGMWRDLIGNVVDFISHDNSNQILELRGQDSSVYLSTQERGSWSADVLYVSTTLPEFSS
ncbi:hypothetical protein [Microbulbifer sp. JTAC008]|uniref:hypothetical protein n=1 Tax=unclassified Microbulbifer TaxID=2619833 RepID=UPI00403A63B3